MSIYNYITAAMLGKEQAESNCSQSKAVYNVQSQVLWDHQINSQQLLKEATYRPVRCLAMMSDDNMHNEMKFYRVLESAVKPMVYQKRIVEDKVTELADWASKVNRKANSEYIHSSPSVPLTSFYDRELKQSIPLNDYDAFASHILNASQETLGYESINYLLVQMARVIQDAIAAGIALPKRTDELVSKYGAPNWGGIMSQWFYLLLAENAFKVGKKYKTSYYESLKARVGKLNAKIDEADDNGASNSTYELEQFDELREKLEGMESFVEAGPAIMRRGKYLVEELNRISRWAEIDFIVSTEIPEIDEDDAIKGFEELESDTNAAHARMTKVTKFRTQGLSMLERLAQFKEKKQA